MDSSSEWSIDGVGVWSGWIWLMGGEIVAEGGVFVVGVIFLKRLGEKVINFLEELGVLLCEGFWGDEW